MNVKRGDNIIYLHLQERLRCSLCRNQQTQAITLSTLIWRNKPYSEHFFNILLSHEVINTPSLNLNFVIYWKWAYDLLSANCWNKASFVLGELISNYLHFAMCLPWTILFLGARCVLGMVRRTPTIGRSVSKRFGSVIRSTFDVGTVTKIEANEKGSCNNIGSTQESTLPPTIKNEELQP